MSAVPPDVADVTAEADDAISEAASSNATSGNQRFGFIRQ